LKKVLVLEGGYNEEHEISLRTAKEIKKILKKLHIDFKSLLVNPETFNKDIKNFSNNYICLNALHGPFGEDGKIQKILKKNNFKMTHSGILSSKNCFNKIKSKEIIRKLNIPTPNYIEVKTKDLNIPLLKDIKKKLNKFVLKPNKSGSSFGIQIVKNDKQFRDFLNQFEDYKKIINNHETLIFEKYIYGKELTVSVLNQKNKIFSLDVTEIITNNKYFDYKAKYTKGFAKHILPAKISKKNYKKCLKYALQAHHALKCNSLSRSDFLYSVIENKIYYLETNTQPGLTKLSLVPEQAKFNNISFEKIILELLINSI